MARATKDERHSATLAIVTGIVVAALQPELLPGMAIGVAAVLAPRLVPDLERRARPLLKTVIRAGARSFFRGIALPLAETAVRAGFTSVTRSLGPARGRAHQRRLGP